MAKLKAGFYTTQAHRWFLHKPGSMDDVTFFCVPNFTHESDLFTQSVWWKFLICVAEHVHLNLCFRPGMTSDDKPEKKMCIFNFDSLKVVLNNRLACMFGNDHEQFPIFVSAVDSSVSLLETFMMKNEIIWVNRQTPGIEQATSCFLAAQFASLTVA